MITRTPERVATAPDTHPARQKPRTALRSLMTLLLAFSLVAILTGCGTSSKLEKGARSDAQGSREGSMQSTAPANETTASEEAATTQAPAAKKIPYAIIETNKGRIVVKLFPEKAPVTVENFIKLANEHFYDGIRWHRVVPGFVIQGGDPLSKDNDPSNDGLGGPGYTIPDEFNDLPHLEGTMAMAHAAYPNTGGSQFYICLAPQPSLDGKYTVFGQTVEGLDVVHKIQVGDVMKTIRIEYRDK